MNLIQDINTKWKLFLYIVLPIINDMCPLKTFSIKQEKEARLTPQVIELIRYKDLALRLAKRWNEAKVIRNNCKKRLRHT